MTTKEQAQAQMAVVQTETTRLSGIIDNLATDPNPPDPTPTDWYVPRSTQHTYPDMPALLQAIASQRKMGAGDVELIVADGSAVMTASLFSSFGDRGNLPPGVTIRPQTYNGFKCIGSGAVGDWVSMYGGDRDLCIAGFFVDGFGKESAGNGCLTIAGDVDGAIVDYTCTNFGLTELDHACYWGTSQTGTGPIGDPSKAPRNCKITVNATMIKGTGYGLHAYHASGFGANNNEISIKVRGACAGGILVSPNFDRNAPANWKVTGDVDGDFLNGALLFWRGEPGRQPADGIDASAAFAGTFNNRGLPSIVYQDQIGGKPAVPTINNQPPSEVPSPDGTMITGPGQLLIDDALDDWTINDKRVALLNGVQAGANSDVRLLLKQGGVYAQNNSNDNVWLWSKGDWVYQGKTLPSPITPPDDDLVEQFINDMKLPNDFELRGVRDPNADWAKGGTNQSGARFNQSIQAAWDTAKYPPGQYQWFVPWAEIFDGPSDPMEPLNSWTDEGEYFVLIGDAWQSLFAEGTCEGGNFLKSGGSGADGNPPDMPDNHVMVDGGWSCQLPTNVLYNWHGWAGRPKTNLDTATIRAVHWRIKGKLLGDAGAIARSQKELHAGADIYWNGDLPGIQGFGGGQGAGRFKKLTGEAQWFSYTSLIDVGIQNVGGGSPVGSAPRGGITADEFRRNPPPMPK